MVRSERELSRIRRYIEWNPVKAALVARPEEFPWSRVATSAEGGAEASRGLKPPPLNVARYSIVFPSNQQVTNPATG